MKQDFPFIIHFLLDVFKVFLSKVGEASLLFQIVFNRQVSWFDTNVVFLTVDHFIKRKNLGIDGTMVLSPYKIIHLLEKVILDP